MYCTHFHLVLSTSSKMFQMKDMGPARNCIGMNIHQGKDFIDLYQTNYVLEILHKFRMAECKPAGTPSDTNSKLSITMVNEENSLVGKVPYQEAVGSLLYLTQATRPDIAFAVNDLSRFNNNHGEAHWTAVKRIFRYLLGTSDYRLRYSKNNRIEIIAFSDADWASEIDMRRSCTGYLVNMQNAAIIWCSKRQPIVALSSTEAEYIALSSVTCEVIWVKQMLKEIYIDNKKPVTVYCDNQSTIKLAECDAFKPRTKYIDIRYHHIRKEIKENNIFVKFVPSAEMAADALTKPMTKEKLTFCAQHMGLTDAE